MNLFLRFLFMGAVCLLPLVGCSDDDTEGTGPEPTSDFQFESLQAANIENIKALAEANGVGVEEFLLEALLKGEQEWKYNTLVPETDYVFYAYGLSTELEILTTVNTYEFKTLVASRGEFQDYGFGRDADVVYAECRAGPNGLRILLRHSSPCRIYGLLWR